VIEFIRYLNSLHTLSPELQAALLKALRQKELRKGQVWLQEGAVCDKFAFIERGLAKICFEAGLKELVLGYALENEPVLSVASYVSQTPSAFSIRAVEALCIVYISHAELQQLLSKYPEFNIHLRLVLQAAAASLETHLALLMMSSRLRYEKTVDLYPWMVHGKRFTDRMLAAWLGITPNCLSKYKSGENS